VMCGGGLQLRVAHARDVIMARGETKRLAAQSRSNSRARTGKTTRACAERLLLCTWHHAQNDFYTGTGGSIL
jgi:hypothetical protein